MPAADNMEFFAARHLKARRSSPSSRRTAGPRPRARKPTAPRAASKPGHVGSVGVIAPYAKDFCSTCNRLRVTSRGRLRLCLFAEGEHSLRPLLQRDDQSVELQASVRSLFGRKGRLPLPSRGKSATRGISPRSGADGEAHGRRRHRNSDRAARVAPSEPCAWGGARSRCCARQAPHHRKKACCRAAAGAFLQPLLQLVQLAIVEAAQRRPNLGLQRAVRGVGRDQLIQVRFKAWAAIARLTIEMLPRPASSWLIKREKEKPAGLTSPPSCGTRSGSFAPARRGEPERRAGRPYTCPYGETSPRCALYYACHTHGVTRYITQLVLQGSFS